MAQLRVSMRYCSRIAEFDCRTVAAKTRLSGETGEQVVQRGAYSLGYPRIDTTRTRGNAFAPPNACDAPTMAGRMKG
jgi:hypothetical protein